MLDDKDRFSKCSTWAVEDFRLQIENFIHLPLTGVPDLKKSFAMRCNCLKERLLRDQIRYDEELRELSIFY